MSQLQPPCIKVRTGRQQEQHHYCCEQRMAAQTVGRSRPAAQTMHDPNTMIIALWRAFWQQGNSQVVGFDLG